MQKELEEAANEVKVVNLDRLGMEAAILSTSVPTKAHIKFVSSNNKNYIYK